MAATLNIDQFLEQASRQDVLRFVTAGSVDDGKSTLIGRLLYDANGLYEDQLEALRSSKINRSTGAVDFSLLTDGLRAEREQGITIDVAYRHFATPRRKFLIADTPGHQQYTRNMATGASTADAAVLLIDARNGVLAQSRRHASIAALLGIPSVVVAVNKMDLVGRSQQVFDAIRAEFGALLERLGIRHAQFIPVSALEGDNVARKGTSMSWYNGPTLLEFLENAPASSTRQNAGLRFPVQIVNRPHLDFRGYSGQVAAGVVKRGDRVMVLPSGVESRVKAISTFDGDIEAAYAPMSVTVVLEDEVDASRGDMIVHAGRAPQVARSLDADIVWMSAAPLEAGKEYLLKHTTHTVRATFTSIAYRLDMETLDTQPAEKLEFNDVGRAKLETGQPLYFDAYRDNRSTGSFVLIDPITYETAGAGMIRAAENANRASETARRALLDVEFETSRVTAAERFARLGHLPATVWLESRRELAYRLERLLFHRGCSVQVLADREESGILPELAEVLHAAGLIAICCAPAGEDRERERARDYIGDHRFVAPAAHELPSDDAAAATKLIEELERLGVLPGNRFDSGEGI